MMPRGFKPVGWVAAVGGAALGCYMLSLNVAAERAALAKIEREILMAKQEIRSLQTELGTRGRLQQLEHWNAEVLALSAPTNAQFLDDAVTLARFEQPEKSFAEKAKVQMASADAAKAAPRAEARPDAAPVRKLPPVQFAVAAEQPAAQPLLRQASYTPGEARALAAVAQSETKPVAAKAAAKPQSRKAEATEPKTVTTKAEAKKPAAKPAGLKAVVARLEDDKQAEVAGAGKSKAEAGLR
jgi:hypothetical protein